MLKLQLIVKTYCYSNFNDSDILMTLIIKLSY